MGVEKERIDTTEQAPEEEDDDLGALCEGISRAIVEGLTSEDRPPEPDLSVTSEAALAETGLILPLGDMVTEKAVSTVEGLLDSDELADRIARVAEEKLQEVLNKDLAKSRTSDAGIIAERVHLECARLFGRASFRKELVRFLQHDIARTITPIIKQDVTKQINGVMVEVTDLILNRLLEVMQRMQNSRAPEAPEYAAPPVSSTGEEAARITEAVLGQVRRDMADLSNQIYDRLVTVLLRHAREPVAPRAPRAVESYGPVTRTYAVADPVDRIRDRLWAEGLL